MARRLWVNFFVREPGEDRRSQAGEWVAWRNLNTGGIWYGRPDETFEVVVVGPCSVCGGRGYVCPVAVDDRCTGGCGPGGPRCRPGTTGDRCIICDGDGRYYQPTVVKPAEC